MEDEEEGGEEAEGEESLHRSHHEEEVVSLLQQQQHQWQWQQQDKYQTIRPTGIETIFTDNLNPSKETLCCRKANSSCQSSNTTAVTATTSNA